MPKSCTETAQRQSLKCWPPYFEAVRKGVKTFEIRKADRPFSTGDILELREWDPATSRYSGRICDVRVTYILNGGQFGVEPGYVVLGIEVTGWNEL